MFGELLSGQRYQAGDPRNAARLSGVSDPAGNNPLDRDNPQHYSAIRSPLITLTRGVSGGVQRSVRCGSLSRRTGSACRTSVSGLACQRVAKRLKVRATPTGNGALGYAAAPRPQNQGRTIHPTMASVQGKPYTALRGRSGVSGYLRNWLVAAKRS